MGGVGSSVGLSRDFTFTPQLARTSFLALGWGSQLKVALPYVLFFGTVIEAMKINWTS
jgi:hypothetical protein